MRAGWSFKGRRRLGLAAGSRQDGLAEDFNAVQTEAGLRQVDADGGDGFHIDSSPSGLMCLAIFSLAHGSLRGGGVHFIRQAPNEPK